MEPTLNNRLEVGEKIFYYDGFTQWDIETVESVNKAEKTALLSNNACISRYPNSDGTFTKFNPNNGYVPRNLKPLVIKRATDDLIRLRTAILSFRKIKSFIHKIDDSILSSINLDGWAYWSANKQEQLICIAGHLAKALEETELDKEEVIALAKALDEPEENILPKKRKKNKK